MNKLVSNEWIGQIVREKPEEMADISTLLPIHSLRHTYHRMISYLLKEKVEKKLERLKNALPKY